MNVKQEQQQQQQQPYSYGGNNGMSNGGAGGNGSGMRRRQVQPSQASYGTGSKSTDTYNSKDNAKFKKTFKKLDMFPKVEQDLTVNAGNSNTMSTLAYILTVIIVLAEIYNHFSLGNVYKQHASVDKSLGASMRVDLNISFPALHCNDVHIDIMDVAGDAHNDVDTTMHKRRLHFDGSQLSKEEIQVSINRAHQKEIDALEAIDKGLRENYCGPCYGAQEIPGDCCNHCDDVVRAYKQKKWDASSVLQLAEQCVREEKTKPKKLTGGEGCEIAGYMEFNRVNGNFHIAMGEGVERNGQHIHTFLPEDTQHFNVSHVINELRFGPQFEGTKDDTNSLEKTSLDGVTKILTKANGVSGMFQYFIKIVPTTYKGKQIVKEIDPQFDFKEEDAKIETNRYFVTERFIPLMEPDDQHWELGEYFEPEDDETDDDKEIAAAHVGGNTGHSHSHTEHMKQMAVLPGLFFIYQVYPFTVEISKDNMSYTHLFIRILATVGGVFAMVGWIDNILHNRQKKGRNRPTR
mmetsp:Transcript_9715/g.14131  ORF Transcript_9715/g.14131 Transcript_9715/m.14131 type:complete len:518 (-) Transcript_9715:118-1671(-)